MSGGAWAGDAPGDGAEGPSARFWALHHGGGPLLMPNAWDVGSARLLAALGFEALATTSSGFAATLGRVDYRVTRDEVLAHATALAGAVDVPVSVDAEDGFGAGPDEVAHTVTLLAGTGAAGCSIEDHPGPDGEPPLPVGVASERVAAAAEAAHAGPQRLVLTARAENYLHDRPDLADTIARLQAYQEAGADVLYAPGLVDLGEIRTLVAELDRPVNVLALPRCPPVAALAEAGVARVSVGGAFAYASLAGAARAAVELRDQGTYGWWDQVAEVRPTLRDAFGG